MFEGPPIMIRIFRFKLLVSIVMLALCLCVVIPEISPENYSAQASTIIIIRRWRLTVRTRTSVSTSKKKKKQVSFSLQTDLSIPLNKKTKLKVKKLKNANKVKWAVSDPTVLKIKKKGKYSLLTGLKPGIALVKAKARDVSQYCLVVVGGGEAMSPETKLWMRNAYMNFGGIYPQTNSISLNEGGYADVHIHYTGIGNMSVSSEKDIAEAVFLEDAAPSGDATLRIYSGSWYGYDFYDNIIIKDDMGNTAYVGVEVKAKAPTYSIEIPAYSPKSASLEYLLDGDHYTYNDINYSIIEKRGDGSRHSTQTYLKDNVTVKSSNEAIAKASIPTGSVVRITGHSPGKATITLSYKNAPKVTIPVTVTDKYYKIDTTPTKINTSLNSYEKIYFSVYSVESGMSDWNYNKYVTVTSSNPAVATASKNTRYENIVDVVPKSKGTAVITLSCHNGSTTIPVTVK